MTFESTTTIFIKENEFENVVRILADFLSRSQYFDGIVTKHMSSANGEILCRCRFRQLVVTDTQHIKSYTIINVW